GWQAAVGPTSHAAPPEPVTKEGSQVFRTVVKKVLPAVVSVSTKAKTEARAKGRKEGKEGERPDMEKFFRNPEELRKFFEGNPGGLREFLEEGVPDHPPIPQSGFGSGVIVDPAGIVVTNNHVVEDADEAIVTLQDGREFTTADILRDPKTDLAVVRLNPKEVGVLPYAKISDSSHLEIGDWVIAMGAPFGLRGTVTAGIVSARGRQLGASRSMMYEDFVQTDAAINPGNSGGPLVDLDGDVVGINTAIRSNSGSFEGIGFAVPGSLVKPVVDNLVKYGKVKRGYLGIVMGNLPEPVRRKMNLAGGVSVSQLTEGQTPARKAGLQSGDVIVKANNQPIRESRELQMMVSTLPAGQKLNLGVLRDGAEVPVVVTIEEQPDNFGVTTPVVRRASPKEEKKDAVSLDALGLSVAAVDDATVEKYELPVELTGKAVVVAEVDVDGLAAAAGLSEGLVVLQVEKQAVSSPDEVAAIVAKIDLAEGVLLKVRTPDGNVKLIVLQKK
ncbi:MAG: trypsin-like peptidase domain-containing protein, partial [Planctomycetia bacterium]